MKTIIGVILCVIGLNSIAQNKPLYIDLNHVKSKAIYINKGKDSMVTVSVSKKWIRGLTTNQQFSFVGFKKFGDRIPLTQRLKTTQIKNIDKINLDRFAQLLNKKEFVLKVSTLQIVLIEHTDASHIRLYRVKYDELDPVE